jgi:hypothetical protein
MTKNNERALALATIAELVPPIVRHELLGDESLQRQFDLKIDPILDLSPDLASFKASKILEAVSAAADGPDTIVLLTDVSGKEYKVLVTANRSAASLVIQSENRKVRADHFLFLTQNRNARLLALSQQLKGNSCAAEIQKRWRRLIEQRALSHRELALLAQDFGNTPALVASTLQLQLRQAQLPLETLVPHSLEYYERLVGRLEGQKNIVEYVEQVASKHIGALLAWDKTEGLRAALLLGAHSLIADRLAKESISPTVFLKLVQWAKSADPLAQTAVLELALKRSAGAAKWAPAVQELAKNFCKVEQGPQNSFAILSAVFHLVDGELGKRRVMVGKAPFWRRLATLAQAALITRCMFANGAVPAETVEGMDDIRMTEYQMQGIVDMRTEPRWQGDFASPYQLRNELGGRVFAAASLHERTAVKLGVRDLFLGDSPSGLKAGINLMSARLPGPLEGNVDPIETLPEDILQKMRDSLADPTLSILSFALISNTSLFVRLPEDVLVRAAEAVRRANYHLDPKGKPEWVETCLTNLATAAAVNRNRRLADEMLIILRSYRRLFRGELSLDAALRIGLISCSSRSDLNEWCECVGALMNDLAFGQLDRREANALYGLIGSLCDLVPELWVTCGQGLAAAEAVSWD